MLSLAWLALSGFNQPYSAGAGVGEALIVVVPALVGIAALVIVHIWSVSPAELKLAKLSAEESGEHQDDAGGKPEKY